MTPKSLNVSETAYSTTSIVWLQYTKFYFFSEFMVWIHFIGYSLRNPFSHQEFFQSIFSYSRLVVLLAAPSIYVMGKRTTNTAIPNGLQILPCSVVTNSFPCWLVTSLPRLCLEFMMMLSRRSVERKAEKFPGHRQVHLSSVKLHC